MRCLLFILSLCILSSCNFTPIYNTKNLEISNELSAIEIDSINSIAGAEFSYYLSNMIRSKANIKYLLKVQFHNLSLPIIIGKNSDIFRQSINQLVTYQLLDINTHQELTSGKFKHLLFYNLDYTTYAAYVVSKNAIENLTKSAAEELYKRLILYFDSNQI